jgi:hypothetical protein
MLFTKYIFKVSDSIHDQQFPNKNSKIELLKLLSIR